LKITICDDTTLGSNTFIGVLRGEDDYRKIRNYWKYLKARLKKDNNELVSATTQLKLCLDWSKINKIAYLTAMEKSVLDSTQKKRFCSLP
jgi:hypothetical protein